MVLVNDNHFKVFYHCGLKEWDYEKGYLIDTCLSAQDKYKADLDYFRIAYENNKSRLNRYIGDLLI